MISDKQKAEIKHTIDHTVAKFVDSLPSRLHQMLGKSVCNILGLKADYWGDGDKFEVDHCNGNKGLLASMVKKRTLELCEAEVDSLVNEFIPTLQENAGIKKALFKECDRLYRQCLREALIRLAKERAEKDAEGLLNGFDTLLNGVSLGPVNTELSDPESFEGPMGRLLLEQKVLDLGLVEGGDPVERVLNR